jgi:hypothetical protein
MGPEPKSKQVMTPTVTLLVAGAVIVGGVLLITALAKRK